jgi:hypothetical protein
MDASNKKPAEKIESSALVATNHTRLKKPPERLTQWIRLANIVPPGTELPEITESERPRVKVTTSPQTGKISGAVLSWSGIVDRISELPPAVQSELLKAAKETVPREVRDRFPSGVYIPDDFWPRVMMIDRYNEIRTAYIHLRMISQSEGKSIDPFESLVAALRESELDYIRQCGHCGKIFYAGNQKQRGCTPIHSRKVREENKKRVDRETKQMKRDRKKRASKTRMNVSR